jgi:hypothetical protein
LEHVPLFRYCRPNPEFWGDFGVDEIFAVPARLVEIGGFTPIIRSPPLEDQKNYPLGFVKCLFNDSNDDAEYSSIPLEEGTYAKRSNIGGDDLHEDQIFEHSLCSNIGGETVVNE